MPAELSDKQADTILSCLDSPERIHCLSGAVRSGKTMSLNIAWLEYARTGPGQQFPLLMVGKTKDTLQRNVLDPINNMFGTASPLEHTPLSNQGKLFGRTVYMVGANDRKAETRIRGLTLAGTLVDEATLLPDLSYWQMLRTRHLTVPGAKIFLSTNPDSPRHWLKTEVMDNPDANCRTYHFTLDDNPTIDPAERLQLEASMTGLFHKRFIQGMWVQAEGAIFDMLDEATHTAPGPRNVGQCWLGIDYGTSNSTAATLWAHDPATQRLHAIAEWVHDGRKQGKLTDVALSRGLQKWLAGLERDLQHDGITVVVDPSAASLITQMRADGWRLTGAQNAVLDGIRAMANLFALRRAVIDADACPTLWTELQSYAWDEAAQLQGIDKPRKVDDHATDSARYSLMSAWPVWRGWTSLPSLVPA